MSTPPLPTVNGTEAYKCQIHWILGAPEDISYTVYGPDAASLLAGKLPPNGGVLPISLGGGTVDARMLSNGAQLVYDQPGYVSETGKSIGYALQTSAIIHRFTAQQIRLQDAFNGAANSITIQNTTSIGGSGSTAGTNVITTTLPDQAGIALTPVGATSAQQATFAFTFLLDAAVQQVVLDVDINEDNLLHATQMICERLGSFVDPQQTNFSIDSGDAGPDGKQSVVIGRKGASSITFDGNTIPVLRLTTAQAQTTDMCASCTFVGGDTNHGFPATGKITGLCASFSGYALAGFYAQINVGGVYFWRGDGAFYPISQAMGVNAIWPDSADEYVYAATDVGVYRKSTQDLFTSTLFERLGAMSLKCSKVQVESAVSPDGFGIYCLAAFNGTSEQHVLQYDGISNLHLGYDGWKTVVSFAGLSDFAVMGGFVFGIVSNSPGTIFYQSLVTPADKFTLSISTGVSILGLDPVGFGGSAAAIFVRTDQGSQQLYVLTAVGGSASLTAANTDSSLVDSYGSPILVNRIQTNTTTQLECTTGKVSSALLASTSLGVFTCSDISGQGGWQRTDGQSSIGDFSCNFAAATFPDSYQGRAVQGVYAAADAKLYVSQNGSVNWIDATSQPLDAGPAFWDFFWEKGSAPSSGDSSIPVTYGGTTYTLLRTLSGVGQWVYTLSNPNSQAPAGQHRSAEISEISTPALMDEVTASYLLVKAMARFLAWTGRPQIIVEVESYFTDLGSPLRGVRPGMAASVSGVPMDYIIAPNSLPFALGSYAGSFFVLEHTITYDRDSDPGACTTKTRLGSLLLAERTDPLTVTADLFYQVSRVQRYRAGKGG